MLLHKGPVENSSLYRISRKGGTESKGVYVLHLKIKNLDFKLENFQKSMKNLPCLNSWKEILRFFDVFKILSKISRKFRQKFRTFWEICICIEIIKTPENSMETCKSFQNFHELWPNIYRKKLNFNKDEGEFNGLLKLFNNSKRNYKTMDKSLRVLAKNQLKLEIFAKDFKFKYKNSNWKLMILPIFSPIFQHFCHFIHLWNTIFLGVG